MEIVTEDAVPRENLEVSRKIQTPGTNIGKVRKQRRRTLYLGKLRKKQSPQKIQVFHKPFL